MINIARNMFNTYSTPLKPLYQHISIKCYINICFINNKLNNHSTSFVV